MTEKVEHRYEVSFTASKALDGRPIIALVLDQDGQTAAGEDNVFFLELGHGVDPEATSRTAAFLGQYIKGFGVMTRIPQAIQAALRDEPGPNSEEEGQPIPPPQIDSVKEAEAEESHSRSGSAEGPARSEES